MKVNNPIIPNKPILINNQEQWNNNIKKYSHIIKDCEGSIAYGNEGYVEYPTYLYIYKDGYIDWGVVLDPHFNYNETGEDIY